MLAGCAAGAPIPTAITVAPPGNLQLVEALRDIGASGGARVRWGGTIVAVGDEGGGARRIEVLERKLDAGGRPLDYTASDGRFVIRAAADVEPWRYSVGSDITVAGDITGMVTASNGAPAPVVHVAEYQRWSPPRRYYDDYYYPGWYDDPLYGTRPWGWRHGHPWYGPYPPRYGGHVGIGIGL